MLLDALMRMDQNELRMLAGAAVARFAGMEPGRPVGGAYYLYRTLRQLDADGLVSKMMDKARQDEQIGEAAFDDRLAREEFDGRLKVLQGDDRGRDPTPAGRRPWRRGDGAHAAQAVARRRRLHARVARGDAAAPARDLPAHPRPGCPARAAAAAPAARPPRLPPDGAPLDVVRRRAGRAEVQAAAPVEARDHGRRRHLRLGRIVRPFHAAVRVRDAERVLEGALVGVHRRCRRGHALLRRVATSSAKRSTV